MARLPVLLAFIWLWSGFTGCALASANGDGYPDVIKLYDAADRRAFMEWFASIAEAQYTAKSPDWEHQDCSGLLRYAFVEALKPKTAAWFAKFPYLPRHDIPSIKGLSYPVPELGRSVFRVAPGPYRPDDVQQGKLVGLATAAELMNYGSVYLGRTPDVARRGDLLFFAHPTSEGSGYHSMVYLGGDMVVYHTGLSPAEGGEVRLLSLATLRKHPDPSWHPVTGNPHFLGFYRWKIVY